MKYNRTPCATSLPYSTSSGSNSSTTSGEIHGTESESVLITSDYINRSIYKAKLYSSIYERRKLKEQQQQQQETDATAIVREVQGLLSFQAPPIGMPDFYRYREKVQLFIREITRAYGERKIEQSRYEEFLKRYDGALLHSYEDEFHILHCRIPCKRCSDMVNVYLHSIYS